MTSATPKKRTWAAYACPVCRFVFRVPRDHTGNAVICPACHYLLKIPQQRSARRAMDPLAVGGLGAPQPLATEPRDKKENKPIASRALTDADILTSTPVAEPRQPESSQPEAPLIPSSSSSSSSSRSSSSTKRRKRVRRSKRSNSTSAPSWEENSSSRSKTPGNSLGLIIGGAVLVIAIVAAGVWVMMGPNQSDQKSRNKKSIADLSTWENFQASNPEVKITAEEQQKLDEIEESVNTGMDVIAQSEKVVQAFLTAEKASDLESLVRTPEVTIPRMKKWYATHPWKPPGVKKIGYGGGITVKGVMASMSVRLNDYSIKHIAVERTDDGYLVDWESWVAWTDMDWEDLFKKRPTELVEVRVLAKIDSYYNRLFSDDTKWLAVNLTYLDADRTIYGYIERETSTLTTLLGDLKGGRTVPVTIKIRYPEGSVADNQVSIEEYVQNGWVRAPQDKTSKAKTTEKPSAAKDATPPSP